MIESLRKTLPDDLRKHFDRLCQTALLNATKQQMVLAILLSAYSEGKNGQLAQKDIADRLQPNYILSTTAIRQHIRALRTKLRAHIQKHPEETAKLLVEEPQRGYRILLQNTGGARSFTNPMAHDQALLDVFLVNGPDGQRKEFHAYHLTVGPNDQPRWEYKIARFHPADEGGLRASVFVLPKAGILQEEERNLHRYVYHAAAPIETEQLILTVRRAKGMSLEGVETYPNVAPHTDFPWCGVEIIRHTFKNLPANSLCILHEKQFDYAKRTPDDKPISDGDPITDPDLIKALCDEWHRSSKNQGLRRLP